MRVYFYTDEEMGVPWPGPDADRGGYKDIPPRFNWCEFPGFDVTEKPEEADVFVVRQRLSQLTDEQLLALPHRTPQNIGHHVFFDLADNFYLYPIEGAIQFRGCADMEMVAAQPSIIPIAWPTEDFGHLTDFDWEYDVVFQGQHNVLADRAMDSCVNVGLKCNFVPLEEFWPHIRNKDHDRGMKLWDSFRENIRTGRLSLCPRTLERGVIRYRLYEAMSMKRVSVFICDTCIGPFPDRIDWDMCIIKIWENQVDDTGPIIRDWLAKYSEQELIARGNYAREAWETYLDRRQYGKVIAEKVKEIIGAGD